MISLKEQSYINIAETILKQRKEPIDLYELFDQVIEMKNEANFNEDDITEVLTSFYADLTSSAKFVYTGSNTWDLKANQKIELWEKDGSYYNEYTEVTDDVMDARIEAQEEKARQHAQMLEERKIREEELAKQEAMQPEEAVLDEKELQSILSQDEELIDDESEELKPEDLEEEKVVLDEFDDDFDEEKYNEYMDQYEDKYDDK